MSAVVIHEFEVEVPPDSPSAGAAPAAAEAPAPHVGAHEIECILRRHLERAARLWAH